MLDQTACWNAVMSRDASQDGQFFFGVMTTGVYCRPSCPARKPLLKNVRFYETSAEAEKDGLRPCLRCRPLETLETNPLSSKIRSLCDYIRTHSDSGESLTLQKLSRQVGLSPFHLQRSFKAAVGVTPKQYIEACRIDALKGELRTNGSVTEAIYGAGFSSSSRVYERIDTRLGMTPSQYRAGGKNVFISYVSFDSPLGLLMMGATDRGLCFLQFGDSQEELLKKLAEEYPSAQHAPMQEPYPEQFRLWMDSLSQYLQGEQRNLDIPLDVQATAFQLKVWKYLQSIPRGSVQSYSEVAQAIGQPTATRAVAHACASNRVAIVIPCHRVICGNGELGGYRWGMERKRVLIDRERSTRAERSS